MSTECSPHVLVMDDAPEMIDLLRELLEGEGYRVSTSLHTLELDRVRELAPDVIVLDILFERQLKGRHFLTMSRLDPALSRIPVVLCTAAVTTVEPMLENLAAQQVRVILKPFEIEELLIAIDGAVLGLSTLPDDKP